MAQATIGGTAKRIDYNSVGKATNVRVCQSLYVFATCSTDIVVTFASINLAIRRYPPCMLQLADKASHFQWTPAILIFRFLHTLISNIHSPHQPKQLDLSGNQVLMNSVPLGTKIRCQRIEIGGDYCRRNCVQYTTKAFDQISSNFRPKCSTKNVLIFDKTFDKSFDKAFDETVRQKMFQFSTKTFDKNVSR